MTRRKRRTGAEQEVLIEVGPGEKVPLLDEVAGCTGIQNL
jgi:hypothetical protein